MNRGSLAKIRAGPDKLGWLVDWVYIRSNHLEKVSATKLKNHIVDMLVESKAQYERAKSKKPPPPRPKYKAVGV